MVTGAGAKAFCAGGDLKQRNGMTDRTMAGSASDLRADDPRDDRLPGADHRRGEWRRLCRRHGNFPVRRLHLRRRNRPFRADRGNPGHHARRWRHAKPAACVGARRAKEILLTGRPFSVQQAFDWGMVNRICKPETLLAEALETAAVIAGNAPISTRQIKQSVNMGLNTDLQTGMMFEIEAYNRMVPTEDRREGIRAFNEKRKPVYKGR